MILTISVLLSSCIQKEFYDASHIGQNDLVVISAKPTGYIPTIGGTKAQQASNAFNARTFENTIYNAFFLLFDDQGILRLKEAAAVDSDNATVSYSIEKHLLNDVFSDARICFIANIPASAVSGFTVGTTKWSNIEEHYLNVNFAPLSGDGGSGCIGVPEMADLNGDGIKEYGLPMFGSHKITENNNISFQMERLLAKVEIHVSLGIEDNNSLTTLTSEPEFSLLECEIHNIPKLIPLTSKSPTTAYAKTSATDQHINGVYLTYNLDQGTSKKLFYSSPDAPTYKSFYFYAPEHKLGNLGENPNPAAKPQLVSDSDYKPIYATINGYLVDGVGTSYEAWYNIYVGENASNNFDLCRNKLYKNYVRINGVNNHNNAAEGNVDHRVKIELIEEMANDVTRSGQSANCYIISSTGNYMLPAYKGAYSNLASAPMCDVGTNAVLACDNPNIIITINEDLSKQSTIVFDVSLQNSANLLSGNAVIARMVNGEVDWSWHLWFIPGIEWGEGNNDLGATNRIGGLQNENMPDGTTMANRNIGVIAEILNSDTWMQGSQSGFYYKYGYRQPYFEDKVYGKGKNYHGLNNVDDSFNTWYDDDGKSITDPCPPGYRVPPITVWSDNNKEATNTHANMYSAFRYWDRGNNNWGISNPIPDMFGLDDIYYPYSGYVNSEGDVKKWEDNNNGTDLKTYVNRSMTIGVYTDEDDSKWENHRRFYKADYYEVNMTLEGYLHSSTESNNKSKGLNYKASIPIIPYKFYYIKKKSKYSWNQSITYEILAETIEQEDIELYSELTEWLAVDKLRHSYTANSSNTDLDRSNGYQVRCVTYR